MSIISFVVIDLLGTNPFRKRMICDLRENSGARTTALLVSMSVLLCSLLASVRGRYPYKLDGEIIHIELFGVASFQYLRSILGCSQDYISQVTVNRSGTYAVAFCPSPRTGVTDVVTWNLETEDHKHIARFPGVLTAGQQQAV